MGLMLRRGGQGDGIRKVDIDKKLIEEGGLTGQKKI